jgi:hypothetical protein
MLYKIINNQVTIDPNTYLKTKVTHVLEGNININKLQLQKTYISILFFPRTIRSWNYLPAAVAQATDLDRFRSGLEGIQFSPAFM